jgi:hypothetical protein
MLKCHHAHFSPPFLSLYHILGACDILFEGGKEGERDVRLERGELNN